MKLRTIYLQRYLSINGHDSLAGRVLFDKFKEISEDVLLGHLIYTNEDYSKLSDPEIKNDVISFDLLYKFEPNILFIEGGLFATNDGMWKFPREIADELCESGGVLIIADADHNEFYQKKKYYKAASDLIKAYARFGENDSPDPIYAADSTKFWKGHRQILCNPEKMIISEWLRPVYEGVPEILVGLPICLGYWNSILSSGNNDTTGTLHLDNWVERIDACPFASVAQHRNGYIVLVAGAVSADVWLKGCPHNTRWLTNTAIFLATEGYRHYSRRISHLRSPHLLFLSHRSTEKDIVRRIATEVKLSGIGIWLDEEQLVPSQSLVEEIDRALGKMTHFVLFWSSNCVDAPWVNRELRSAISRLIEKNIPLFVVRLDTTPVPTIISDIYRIEAADQDSKEIGSRIADAVKRLEKSKKGT